MGVREFAAELKQLIEGIKAEGTAAIYCDNLIAYLDDVSRSPEKEPGPAELERYRAELQQHIDAGKFRHEGAVESFRAVIAAGQSAIRTMLLLNGAAAVAILALVGNLAANDQLPFSRAVANALLPFTLGALAGGLTAGITYLAQWLYGRTELAAAVRAGHYFNGLAVFSGVASYGCFAWGLFASIGILR